MADGDVTTSLGLFKLQLCTWDRSAHGQRKTGLGFRHEPSCRGLSPVMHSLGAVTYGDLVKKPQDLPLLRLAVPLTYYLGCLCPSFLPSEHEENGICTLAKLFEISNANIIHVQIIVIVSLPPPSVCKQLSLILPPTSG